MKSKINRRSFVLSAGAAIAAAPVLASPRETMSARRGPLSDAFLARLPKMMEWASVPGVAVAIISDGQVSWSRGFGVKKVGAPEAVDGDTLFGAASLSKVVFSYAVHKLRDEKQIDLDRPLWEYLPYEDLPAVENSKLITARHVMTHSSGLQNWRFSPGQKLELSFKPGERFQYSGEGFYYLQRVIEKITGRGFEEFMRERVFKPFGMPNSTYTWDNALDAKVASGHNNRLIPNEIFNSQQGKKMIAIAEEWKKPVAAWKYEDVVKAQAIINKDQPPFPNFLLPNTAGSLLTSVNEYAKFMLRLMDNRKRDEFDLSDAARREMLTPQNKINSAISWGLGVGLETDGDRTSFWHWGDNGTFKAFMMGDPVKRSGVVVFTNGQNGQRIWQRIVAEATGADHAAFLFWMV